MPRTPAPGVQIFSASRSRSSGKRLRPAHGRCFRGSRTRRLAAVRLWGTGATGSRRASAEKNLVSGVLRGPTSHVTLSWPRPPLSLAEEDEAGGQSRFIPARSRRGRHPSPPALPPAFRLAPQGGSPLKIQIWPRRSAGHPRPHYRPRGRPHCGAPPTARGESTNATPTRRTARTAEGGARTTAFVARAFPGEGPPAPRHATVSNHSAVSISHDQMWEDLTMPSETRTFNLDDVTLIQIQRKWHSRGSVHHLDT